MSRTGEQIAMSSFGGRTIILVTFSLSSILFKLMSAAFVWATVFSFVEGSHSRNHLLPRGASDDDEPLLAFFFPSTAPVSPPSQLLLSLKT
jgi:hypothetical protein